MEQIKLRKYRKDDLENLLRLFNNESITLDIRAIKRRFTRNDEKKWLQNTLRQYQTSKPKEYNLAITVNGEFIGGIGLHKIDLTHKNAEVGYWIAQPYWGKGYATQALKQFLKEMKQKFGFVRFNAFALDYNKASQRVLEKAGFELETKRKKTTRRGGRYIGDYQYALVK